MDFEDLDLIERSEDYKPIKDNDMSSSIFTLNWKNVLGATVSAILSAVLVYLSNLVDISNLNWHQVLGIAITVGATSLLKNFLTTSDGTVGGVPVK
jgi:hypothetical protein